MKTLSYWDHKLLSQKVREFIEESSSTITEPPRFRDLFYPGGPLISDVDYNLGLFKYGKDHEDIIITTLIAVFDDLNRVCESIVDILNSMNTLDNELHNQMYCNEYGQLLIHALNDKSKVLYVFKLHKISINKWCDNNEDY